MHLAYTFHIILRYAERTLCRRIPVYITPFILSPHWQRWGWRTVIHGYYSKHSLDLCIWFRSNEPLRTVFLSLLCHGDGHCDYCSACQIVVTSIGCKVKTYNLLSKDGDKNKNGTCILPQGTFFLHSRCKYSFVGVILGQVRCNQMKEIHVFAVYVEGTCVVE
jgi:hypothetical protein